MLFYNEASEVHLVSRIVTCDVERLNVRGRRTKCYDTQDMLALVEASRLSAVAPRRHNVVERTYGPLRLLSTDPAVLRTAQVAADQDVVDKYVNQTQWLVALCE